MKKLGIVGGVGWPSTIDYYRALCRLSAAYHAARPAKGPVPTPEMTVESLDLNKSFAMRGGAIDDDASWESYDHYFQTALQRLERAGCEVAIIASNTPHNRFSAITRAARIPVLSIFEAVGSECVRLGVRELLILGTAPTMELPVFANVLSRFGVRAYAPHSAAARAETAGLIAELYAEAPGAASRVRAVVDASLRPGSMERVVCLACTELPLAFPDLAGESSLVIDGIRYLNSTMIHARAAFAALLPAG